MTNKKQEQGKEEACPPSLSEEVIDLGRRFTVFKGLAKSKNLSESLINYLFGLLELDGEIIGAKLAASRGEPDGAAYHLVNAKISIFNIGIGRYTSEGNPGIEYKDGEPIRIIPSIQDLKLESNKVLYQHAQDRYFKGVREVRAMARLECLTDEQISQRDDQAWGFSEVRK